MKKSNQINKIIAFICIILVLLIDMSFYTSVLAYDDSENTNSTNEDTSQIDIGDEALIIKNDKNSKKSEQMESLEWTRDMSPSIGNIDISNAGKTVKMTGNRNLAGKNAIYIIPEFPQEQTLQFDYNIDFGDSFNAAGVLLKVQKNANNTLSGYMLSFNNSMWSTDTDSKLRCNMEIYISIRR